MKENEYQCNICKGIFQKTREDEEAISEMESVFGPVPVENQVIVCDDCFQFIRPDHHPDKVAAYKKEMGQ